MGFSTCSSTWLWAEAEYRLCMRRAASHRGIECCGEVLHCLVASGQVHGRFVLMLTFVLGCVWYWLAINLPIGGDAAKDATFHSEYNKP
jgi:hypothetical protein